MPKIPPTLIVLLIAILGCNGPAPESRDDPAPDRRQSAAEPADDSATAGADPSQRPPAITDSLSIEGMREPVSLRLYRAPEAFPLPFSAYVPENMAAEAGSEGDGASVHFYAEFGGQRNELAFVHVYVYAPGTDLNEAMAVVRAYDAGRGVPVSQGIEPLEDADRAARMPWAERGFTFRYQAGGQWYVGSIGLGQRQDQPFHIIRHYPAEYGDGFGPRAALILETWRWADGTPLETAS